MSLEGLSMSREKPDVSIHEASIENIYETCHRCGLLLRKALWHNARDNRNGHWEELKTPITLLLGIEHICHSINTNHQDSDSE